MFDEEEAKKPAAYVIGQNLEDMSVEEIAATIEALQAEISRLEAARKAKSDHLSAAEALFAKPG
ncbi:MAG: DUF1192 domain-containing protein [Nitratireductor sp.]|nr:DUF1192 domain-containing protein [Nitratireductor sp.]